LTIVSANWSRISECSKSVMEILQTYGPVEKMSVDEAYVDLSEFEMAETIADEIRKTVKEKTGLPCSVGLATSKLVAKVASDFDKPEGFTVVLPGTEAAFLAPMPTRAIHGIGPKSAERLQALGIETCAQLASAEPAKLQPYFKNQTDSLIRRAQGIDRRKVSSESGPSKSISQEWTFSQDISDQQELEGMLQRMCAKVASSVQKQALLAHTVTIKLRWSDFSTITRQKSMDVGIDQEEDIYRLAHAIWMENWQNGRPVRLLGVGVSNLQKPSMRQMPLF
ncbi:MAG: DNA polymerase IV, partial [Chloroflexota bacterium]